MNFSSTVQFPYQKTCRDLNSILTLHLALNSVPLVGVRGNVELVFELRLIL